MWRLLPPLEMPVIGAPPLFRAEPAFGRGSGGGHGGSFRVSRGYAASCVHFTMHSVVLDFSYRYCN
jgi:hypothetical protein